MTYFSLTNNGWYELDQLNLSGTNITGTSEWFDIARFDNENIELDFILYRSAYDNLGTQCTFTPVGTSTGTSKLSVRILPPNQILGLGVINNLSLNLGTMGTMAYGTSIGLVQDDYNPPRYITKNSRLQAKVDGNILEDIYGTNNRLYLHFAFLHNGIDPQLTTLID